MGVQHRRKNRQLAISFDPSEPTFRLNEAGSGIAQCHRAIPEIGYTTDYTAKRGIDVSEWQDTIDWSKVKKSNVDFAFVRISYGLNHIDMKYRSHFILTLIKKRWGDNDFLWL